MADIENLSIRISASTKSATDKLNALADALKRVNAELDRIDPSRLEGLANTANGLTSAMRDLNRTSTKGLQGVAENLSNIGSSANNVQQAGTAVQNLGQGMTEAAQGAQNAARSFGEVGENAENVGANGFQRFGNAIRGIGESATKLKDDLGAVGNVAKKAFSFITAPARAAAKAVSSLGKSNGHTATTAKTLAKELTRVGKMMKLMVTRMVLRKIISGIGDGFKNLAQYSSEVNASMSLLWNSFRQLGNSIAAAASPLLNAFAPALNYVIQLIIKVVEAINQLISALLGLGSFTRAKKLTDSYGASLDKSNKSAKELKKTLLGFDEINQLQDNTDNGSGGGGGASPASMFEEAKIEDKWKKIADKIKKIWDKLIAPIKKAWADVGDYVVKSWKAAFKSIGKLAKSIGRDFLEVWNQEKTVEMFRNIFRIIGDIGQVVKNLADGLDKAWNKNQVGLHILEKIRDIFAIVIEHIRNMTDATAKWAEKLDFTPMFEAIDAFLGSISKEGGVIDSLMGTLEDFYTQVLLPLGKWATEEGGPKLIQVFTDFSEKVDWELIRERLSRVWEILEKLGENVGEGFIKFLDKAADSLAGFLNSGVWDSFISGLKWLADKLDADTVASGIDKIVKAFLVYEALNIATGLATAVKTIAANSALKVTISIAIVWAASTLISRGYSELLQWITKKEMEGNKASKYTIDVEMKWWDNFQSEYFSLTSGKGITGFFSDFFFGDSDQIVHEQMEKARNEVRGTTEEIRKSTIEIQNAAGETTRVIDNYGNVIEDYSKRAGDASNELTITVEKDTDSINTSYKNATNAAGEYMEEFTYEMPPAMANASGVMAGTVQELSQSIDSETKAGFEKASENSKTFTQDMPQDVKDAQVQMSGAVNTLSGDFDKNMSEVQRTVDGSTKEINSSFDLIKNAMTEKNWTFQGMIDGFKATFEGVKSAISPIWNSITDKLNGEYSIFGQSFRINLPRFANGGFPENGLFLANSTEMVGRFSNGKTAVANNEQITDGIAQAVYAAMTSANSQGGGQYINNTIVVDGDVIARCVTKGQDRMNRRYSPTMA